MVERVATAIVCHRVTGRGIEPATVHHCKRQTTQNIHGTNQKPGGANRTKAHEGAHVGRSPKMSLPNTIHPVMIHWSARLFVGRDVLASRYASASHQ